MLPRLWFSLDAYALRKALYWLVSGYRPMALLPSVILGSFWIGGVQAMIVIAAVSPAASIVISLVFARRGADNQAIDSATGLGLVENAENWLETKLLTAKSPTHNIALMAISIDDLDSLEDRIGVPMHETILSELAERLGGLIRQGDMIGRGSHTDFLICLADIRPPESENMLHLARRLQAMLDAPFHHGSIRVYCTISIGIARARQLKVLSPLGMIRAAERANSSARLAGPGSIRIFQSDCGQSPRTDHNLGNQISPALENGEIVGWYQPQISTDTGAISGFEALARWEHPERGLISPATFLTLIERSGLSQRLAEVILTHALSALRAWDKASLGVPTVAVNFSSEELRNPRLVEYLSWEFDRHGIAPHRLGIEVLENVIAESHDDIVAKNLRALADLGCRIDLDDFGTGYTSILNIRRFSVSRIKIDRRLVSRIDADRDQRDLVAALLAMSERLNVETLGEGVETPAEHTMLAQLGCDHIQGFCVARPMPLGDTLTWIRDHHARFKDNQPFILPATPGNG
ncbi:MAG: putative bifunctional diguanylate cyclase/phosphodiesterase [Boseongicola sp.]